MLDYYRERMNNGVEKTFEHPEVAPLQPNTITQLTDLFGIKYLFLGCLLLNLCIISCGLLLLFVVGGVW